MGSSIGNLNRTEAAAFLRGYSSTLGPRDSMLIGVDACQDKDLVFHAYNDEQGKTHDFILNGLVHANRLLGKEVFRKNDWKVVGEYDEEAGRHQAFVTPVRDVIVEDVLIRAEEKVRIEESYKYSLRQSTDLWRDAGLLPQARFGNRIDQYRKFPATTSSVFQSLPLPRYSSRCETNTYPSCSRRSQFCSCPIYNALFNLNQNILALQISILSLL